MKRKVKHVGSMPPNIMLHLFQSLIEPILTYGSEVWGVYKQGPASADKVFMKFARCLLGVKASTSNLMTLGECGHFPPSVPCAISVLCYLNRLHHMSDHRVVKQVFIELKRLHDLSFPTWVTQAEILINH